YQELTTLHRRIPYSTISPSLSFFFFNDRPPTELYTLSLHDALPISCGTRDSSRTHSPPRRLCDQRVGESTYKAIGIGEPPIPIRSEEHTSELQSRGHLVCRLLLEKKK